MIVEHTITRLQGRVRETAPQLSPFDGEPGPWHYVEWEDGFACWAPDHTVEEVGHRG